MKRLWQSIWSIAEMIEQKVKTNKQRDLFRTSFGKGWKGEARSIAKGRSEA
jgi:hypothetical protein